MINYWRICMRKYVNKMRYWVIMKLAGNTQILININFEPHVVLSSKHDSLIQNCYFENSQDHPAITIKCEF